MQDDVQQRAVDLQATVVVDEAHLPEFVHKEVDAAAGGADEGGERFLGDGGNDGIGAPFFAILREEQKGAGKALFRRIEELVDQIRFHARVALQHVGNKLVGKILFLVQRAHHLFFGDNQQGCRFHGGSGGHAQRGTVADAGFANEVARLEHGDDGFFSLFIDDRDFHGTRLDERNRVGSFALGEDFLGFSELDNSLANGGSA